MLSIEFLEKNAAGSAGKTDFFNRLLTCVPTTPTCHHNADTGEQ